EAAPDKYQSYMRSIMRSTAEENGRDPRIAEGMVDQNIVIDSVKQAGKVITFTTSEAIENGYCEGKVDSIEEILKKNNVTNYEIEIFRLGNTEKIISIFLNAFISGILILIIIGGIYFELQTPGVGFPLLYWKNHKAESVCVGSCGIAGATALVGKRLHHSHH
ncbi:MAG: hypothetical protein K2U26_07815, partial [Cyclobacteriaceae bacterium]|nr:hypothetical protein [Cyclobacteriaceae bacterium]